MKETFYIHLQPSGSADPAHWCLRDTTGAAGSPLSGSVEDALRASQGLPVVVLVPSEQITLTRVDLPRKQIQKTLKAVPYALEEQIGENVDGLHFAINASAQTPDIPVAVIDKTLIQQLIETAESQGVYLEAVYPDVLSVPFIVEQSDSNWSVLLDGHRAVVRTGLYSGFVCESDNLADYILLADPPDDLQLKIYSTRTESGVNIDDLPYACERGLSTEAAVAHLVRGTEASQNINLLQGEYARTPEIQKWIGPWKLTAALAMILLLLTTLSMGIERWRLSQQNDQMMAAAEAAFSRAFPQTQRRGDIFIQSQQQLQILGRGQGPAGFLATLQSTSEIMTGQAGITLQEIQFRNQVFSLGLEADDVQALGRLEKRFEQAPDINFKVQSANANAEGVQVRATVEARK